MNKDMLDRMKRATELTRSGRLADATALLQGALGGAVAPRSTASRTSARKPANDVIEGECVEVARASDGADTSPAPSASARAQPVTRVKDLLHKWRGNTATAQVPDVAATNAKAPGQFGTGSYANAAGERAYKLYVPSSYAAGQSLPLIVMLHGCTQGPDDFAAGTQMNVLAEEKRCLVLYPAQSNGANHSRCWNWFRREDQARDRGEPSIIAGMTREVIQRYGVDARRVYIAGLSAGGAMAAVMAVTYPELYAAVGIHSGLACGSAHDLPSALAAMRGMPAAPGVARSSGAAAHATPTIVFHGDQDKTVHPRNGADVIARSEHHEGGPGGEVSSEGGQAAGGHAFTRTVHRDAAGHVLLEHWLVHGGGHAWFGGSQSGSYTDTRGPNASAEMVRFFLSQA